MARRRKLVRRHSRRLNGLGALPMAALLIPGALVIGALVYFFWPKKATAEELAYAKQLTNEQLMGLMQAAAAGLGYSNLSAEQTKQLAVAVKEELNARGISTGRAATATPNLPQVSVDVTQMGRPAVATAAPGMFTSNILAMQEAMRRRQQQNQQPK